MPNHRYAAFPHRLIVCMAAALLCACGGSDGGAGPGATASSSPTSAPTGFQSTPPNLSPAAALGELIFVDQALSPNQTACISCHESQAALAQTVQFVVPLGGPNGNLPGFRNTPSLAYAMYLPPFSLNGATAGQGQPAVTGVPAGGMFLDGRVDTLQQQAAKPFLSPFEMANTDAAMLTRELSTRPYASQFQAVFGLNIFNDPNATLTAVTQALVQVQIELNSFHPFASKYDAVLGGAAQLTASEANGLALFNNPAKGNCAACHTSTAQGGVAPLFTDHSYRALGVPRNWNIVFNQDATLAANAALYSYVPQNGAAMGTALGATHLYYDMGICGPLRTDLAADTSLCGMFQVPTLRNVTAKQRYFHNGIYTSLCDAVNFHLTRDLAPAHWYVQADGVTPDHAYNDLPAAYRGNVLHNMAPFNSVGTPALSASEVSDVVAFLGTLNDSFDPNATPAASVQCQAVAQ